MTFLQDELQMLMHDVPLDIHLRMWYYHDGCPAHSYTSCQANFRLQISKSMNWS